MAIVAQDACVRRNSGHLSAWPDATMALVEPAVVMPLHEELAALSGQRRHYKHG